MLFGKGALRLGKSACPAGRLVGEYLDHIGASRAFRELYLLPRAMGCFPMPDRAPQHAEIVSLVRFWNVHGLVSDVPAEAIRWLNRLSDLLFMQARHANQGAGVPDVTWVPRPRA